MTFIHLLGNDFTVLDDDDFEKVKDLVFIKCHGGYAIKTSDRTSPRALHVILLGKQRRGFEIDHINGNKLDNRRINLRVVSCSENRRNVPNKRGTYFDKRTKKWWALIRINSKIKYIGYSFKTEEEAHRAYIEESMMLPISFFEEKPQPPPEPTEREKQDAIRRRKDLKFDGHKRRLKYSAQTRRSITNSSGDVFCSIKDASIKNNIPTATLTYWLQNPHSKGNTLGWRYA